MDKSICPTRRCTLAPKLLFLNRQIQIDDFLLKVGIRQNSIHMVANHALMKAMDKRWKNIELFCTIVLSEYEILYGVKLPISVNSLVMEVLGHAYAYKILLKLRHLSKLNSLRKLSLRACLIDCGIKKYDANRWFWDIAGVLKPFLFIFSKK